MYAEFVLENTDMTGSNGLMVRHWIPNPGVPGLKHWVAPMSTQSLILLESIK